jgi:hypothetical protein
MPQRPPQSQRHGCEIIHLRDGIRKSAVRGRGHGPAPLLTATGQERARAEDGGSQDANGHSPGFRVTEEGERQVLSPIPQDEVYRIARELLRNAFQHAQARHIKAEIQYQDERRERLLQKLYSTLMFGQRDPAFHILNAIGEFCPALSLACQELFSSLCRSWACTHPRPANHENHTAGLPVMWLLRPVWALLVPRN